MVGVFSCSKQKVKKKFFLQPLNWVDILAVLTLALSLALPEERRRKLEDSTFIDDALVFGAVFWLCRISSCFEGGSSL